ncbi:hypothetical protein PRN20_16995 [Devosia sp. ZB163]|uniref:hypothetical protein n=1 Tax=Devosia sp. ZB163 TaxID=3025938 RepID=UPI002362492B|nr:hypothetical protein [Devosia sp. ZB163]MDC9825430.1 hypothetical protein [Devosia sp. ZB163]
MVEQQTIPAWRRVIRAIGRAVVTVAVVIYTLLDDLLFPLFRPLINRLSALRLFQRLGEWIGRLPPYAALVALGVPFVVIEPMKVLAIWWAGTGHVITGTVGLLLAHALSLLVVERIFHAGYQPLMRIDWFAQLLGWLFGLRDRAIGWAKSTTTWQVAVRWVRGAREWVRGVIASIR